MRCSPSAFASTHTPEEALSLITSGAEASVALSPLVEATTTTASGRPDVAAAGTTSLARGAGCGSATFVVSGLLRDMLRHTTAVTTTAAAIATIVHTGRLLRTSGGASTASVSTTRVSVSARYSAHSRWSSRPTARA